MREHRLMAYEDRLFRLRIASFDVHAFHSWFVSHYSDQAAINCPPRKTARGGAKGSPRGLGKDLSMLHADCLYAGDRIYLFLQRPLPRLLASSHPSSWTTTSFSPLLPSASRFTHLHAPAVFEPSLTLGDKEEEP